MRQATAFLRLARGLLLRLRDGLNQDDSRGISPAGSREGWQRCTLQAGKLQRGPTRHVGRID